MRAAALLRWSALALLAAGALSCHLTPIVSRNAAAFFRTPARVTNKVRDVYRPEARLAVLWIGHASTLVQIDDKLILTDPIFTATMNGISRRVVEPGIDPADLPRVDAVLISHMHHDHLSYGSLEKIERKIPTVLVPKGGLVYMPASFPFESEELATFETWERDGLRITAVPVDHVGWRYGVDIEWMHTSFTGYVIEYHGIRVHFGGDTAYDGEMFRQTRARFPGIDLAILPISPIHPREFMKRTHVDPDEAVQAFTDLGAKRMIPIHYDTFINSTDGPGEPAKRLREVMAQRGLDEQAVQILRIGEQRVLIKR